MTNPKSALTNEQRYYDVLKRIAKDYDTSDRIIGGSQNHTGLDPEEALQGAYDNIQWEAEAAIKGKRRPK